MKVTFFNLQSTIRSSLGRAAFIAALIVPTLCASGDSTSSDSLRVALSTRLDSLELEKQGRKRLGLPLEELERQTSGIKDSIDLLRKQHPLRPAETAVPQRADSTGAGPVWERVRRVVESVIKPTNLIDRAIIGIGGIALVSGLFLMMSLAFARRRRDRRRGLIVPRSPSGGYTSSGRPAVTPSKFQPEAADDDDEADTDIDDPASTMETRDEPTHLASSPEEDLNLLRRRVRQVSPKVSSAPPTLPLDREDNVSPKPISGDVRQQVIDGASRGLDIAELSRRFHLSSDHIALILKVANKSKK